MAAADESRPRRREAGGRGLGTTHRKKKTLQIMLAVTLPPPGLCLHVFPASSFLPGLSTVGSMSPPQNLSYLGCRKVGVFCGLRLQSAKERADTVYGGRRGRVSWDHPCRKIRKQCWGGAIKSDKIRVIEKGNKHLDGRTKSPQPKSTIGRYLNPQGKAALSGSRDEQTLNPQNQPYSQKGTAR